MTNILVFIAALLGPISVTLVRLRIKERKRRKQALRDHYALLDSLDYHPKHTRQR